MAKFALEVDGLVRQLFDEDPKLPPPWRVIDVSGHPGVADNWVVNADGSVSPRPMPAPVVIAPTTISRAQAKIQLLRTPSKTAGKTLLDDATAAVASAGGEVAIWFADAAIWERGSTYVEQIGKALGLSDAGIDSLFAAAAQIAA